MDLRVFVEPQQGATYVHQLAVAQTAEELGYGAFFRSDHYLAMGDVTACPARPTRGSPSRGIARETSTIRLGTLVTSATFRLPGPLAISVAQVDEMSGGRVELGLGAGWFEDEHEAYAIPFPALGERFDRLDEQLEIITGLWSTPAGRSTRSRATHYGLVDSPALPKPVQPAGPPIIIGGGGRSAPPPGGPLRRRVQHAVRAARGLRRTARPGASACEAAGATRVDDLSSARRRCAAARRRRGRRRAAAIGREPSTSCARTARPARPPRSLADSDASPRPAPSASTSRSSTCPTSTTSAWSPTRS